MTPLSAFAIVAASAFLFLPSACSARRVDTASECTVRSFKEIADDPAGTEGKRFCGEVYAVQRERYVGILEGPRDDSSSPGDPSVRATIKTRGLLTNLAKEPRRYYIEGIVHPQLPCFVKGAGECVPFLHPVTIDLIKAEPR